MMSQLASQFDSLGMAAPFLLGGRLILQKVAASGNAWDDILPDDVQNTWRKWLATLGVLDKFSISRYCFAKSVDAESEGTAFYQLHGFCDASNSAFSSVIYLRRVVNGKSQVSFVLGKSKLVLAHQANWITSRKELEAAKLCCELLVQASGALRHLDCTVHFWTDSQVVRKWITNPDLHLARFVKRRIDKILQVASSDCWNYVHTSVNPADIGTRDNVKKNLDSIDVWFGGLAFLWQEKVKVHQPELPSVSIAVCRVKKFSSGDDINALDRLIETSPDLYT